MRKLSMLVAGVMFAVSAPSVVQAQDKDIVETAVAAGSFKTLAKLLTDAGLIETLKGPGPFTVFAPTDEAFAKVPAATLAALGKDKAAMDRFRVLNSEFQGAEQTLLVARSATADRQRRRSKGRWGAQARTREPQRPCRRATGPATLP